MRKKRVRMDSETELAILMSWSENAEPWIKAVRDGEIESRNLVTNQAIIEAVSGLNPKKVLDVGCGEGWLVRELVSRGIDAMGVDAIPEFVDAAQKAGGGRYRTLSYEDISFSALGETFDVLVCNFSLFGQHSVISVFRSTVEILTAGGSIVVQTLHPDFAADGGNARDGWREGSWRGFSKQFCNPAPWYFRTMESWKELFARFGFESVNIVEPVHPGTGDPASIIFVGTAH